LLTIHTFSLLYLLFSRENNSFFSHVNSGYCSVVEQLAAVCYFLVSNLSVPSTIVAFVLFLSMKNILIWFSSDWFSLTLYLWQSNRILTAVFHPFLISFKEIVHLWIIVLFSNHTIFSPVFLTEKNCFFLFFSYQMGYSSVVEQFAADGSWFKSKCSFNFIQLLLFSF
jgi:hypothetical protein